MGTQRKRTRLLALVLALILLLAGFTACAKTTDSLIDPSADNTSADNAPENTASSSLNGVDLKDFVIVYSDDDSAYSKRAAQYIQNMVKTRTGLELKLAEDDAAAAQYEIVVGETSRPISSRLDPVVGKAQFTILAEDNAIALEGEYFVIAAAAYYFINTYVPKADFEAQIPKQVSTLDPIVKKATNFILMIGDGMGVNTTRLFEVMDNRIAYGDGEELFYGYYLPYQGTARTRSLSGTTDSAASGTALATGTKTLNGYLGRNKDGKDLLSLTELAAQQGKSTAVMSTEVQTGATPSAFSAHASDRNSSNEILASQQITVDTYGTIIDCDYDYYDEAGVTKLRNAITGNLDRRYNHLSH